MDQFIRKELALSNVLGSFEPQINDLRGENGIFTGLDDIRHGWLNQIKKAA